MYGLEAGFGQIALQARDGHRVSPGLGEVDPSNREFLIVVRRVLLVLYVLSALNINTPNGATRSGVSKVYVVITCLENIDLP